MWQQWMMLWAGNAVIGIIEGLVIAKVFRASYALSIVLMVIANYASMWAGALIFGIGEAPSPIPNNLFDQPIDRVSWLLWIGVGVAFALSILIEWPFCFAALPAEPGRFRRSMLATLLAQASSYTCLGLTYFRSNNSMGSEVEVVRSIELDKDIAIGEVLFIDPADGDVRSIQLDGKNLKHLFDADFSHPRHALMVQGIAADDRPPWRLVGAVHERDSVVLITDVLGIAEPFRSTGDARYSYVIANAWTLEVNGVADHRPIEVRGWQARPSGNSGIEFYHGQTGDRYSLSYDTAFASWRGRCITILPGDLAVFEFGPQICLLNIPARQVSFLVRGRGPVVILPRPSAPE
jgi:hypothetical protein